MRIAVRDMGDTGHFGSTLRATPRILTWFARLRRYSRMTSQVPTASSARPRSLAVVTGDFSTPSQP